MSNKLAARPAMAFAWVLTVLPNIAHALPDVAELDINPLSADADGVIARDARVVLGQQELPEKRLKTEHYL